MSTWRQKAFDISPAIKNYLQDPGFSIYELFSQLLDMLKDAHANSDTATIQKIYAYADWCSRQKAKDLWNAAGVSFYEHLADDELVFSQFTRWVKKDIYFQVRGLLEHFAGSEKIKPLDKYYGWTKSNSEK